MSPNSAAPLSLPSTSYFISSRTFISSKMYAYVYAYDNLTKGDVI